MLRLSSGDACEKQNEMVDQKRADVERIRKTFDSWDCNHDGGIDEDSSTSPQRNDMVSVLFLEFYTLDVSEKCHHFLHFSPTIFLAFAPAVPTCCFDFSAEAYIH